MTEILTVKNILDINTKALEFIFCLFGRKYFRTFSKNWIEFWISIYKLGILGVVQYNLILSRGRFWGFWYAVDSAIFGECSKSRWNPNVYTELKWMLVLMSLVVENQTLLGKAKDYVNAWHYVNFLVSFRKVFLHRN